MASSLQGALAAASGCSAHVWQPFSKEDGHGYLEITHAAPVHAVRFNLNNKVRVWGHHGPFPLRCHNNITRCLIPFDWQTDKHGCRYGQVYDSNAFDKAVLNPSRQVCRLPLDMSSAGDRYICWLILPEHSLEALKTAVDRCIC
jgi:hypothetical protein